MNLSNLAAGLILAILCTPAHAAPDASWRQPLADKERALEANIAARHNILGLYPSQVEVPLDGSPVDTSTRGYANIAHSVCWTANYLAGASYRYVVLMRDGAPAAAIEAARQRADELFEAVYRCQLVTGVKGLQSRGYAIGHGESYEERENARTSELWRQGAGAYKDLRWRGSPSHHNYSDATHGLVQYYDLAARGEQKQRARDAIANLVGYWVDNDLFIQHLDPKRKTPVLGFTDGKTPNTRIMMAIAQAKYGHHVTGEAKFLAMYERLIGQFGIRGMTQFRAEKDFDDAEHVFCHLENLFRIEKDPELLAAYRVVADALWANHVHDAQSLFTYIYYGAAAPGAPGKAQALREALYSLQTWPTDTTIKPRMNSLDPNAKPPYPVYAAAWDNEYLWKGSLLRGDGWLSRIVTDVAVPAEDPVVLYALSESGVVYQSRDGAATIGQWFPVSDSLDARPVGIEAGPRVRMVCAWDARDFYLSMSGGQQWRKLPVPAGGAAVRLVIDPADLNVIYAQRENAVYRSEQRRRHPLGSDWERYDGPLPPHAGKTSLHAGAATRAIEDPREPRVRYKAGGREGVLKSTDGGGTWRALTAGLDIPLVQSVTAPAASPWLFAGTPAGLFISKDGGEHWEDGHLTLQFTKNTRRQLGGAAYIDAYWRGRYYGFIDEAAAAAPYAGE